MTSDFEVFLYQILSISLFSYFNHILNFIYLFYNDYETSYTTYINHARWHRWLRSCGKETGVPGGNPPVWLGDHMTISHADAGYRKKYYALNNFPQFLSQLR